MDNITLITGATSGIGEATARLLAGQGYPLIICGRRKERLQELADELEKQTQVHTLSFDVADRSQVAHAFSTLPSNWRPISILVNNAGNAHGLDPIQKGKVEDWEAMIDINVKGLLYVTREVLPDMTGQKSGHIVNIGSIAGIEAYPRGNVYCASKHAVDALSRTMRIDLLEENIKVSEVKPGLVETEFSEVRFKGDKERAKQVYQGMDPLTGQDIAEIIHFIITRPAHVNVADLLVLPAAQASSTLVKRD